MGRAAAIAFAREGADVAINYLPQEESDATDVVALIRDAGRKAVALPGDLREEAFCNRLVADAVSQLRGLDILVSNDVERQKEPRHSDQGGTSRLAHIETEEGKVARFCLTRVIEYVRQNHEHIVLAPLHHRSNAMTGFLGMGTDRYPLPWKVLKYSSEYGGYVVPLPKSILKKAPKYSESEIPTYDRDYGTRVDSYYQQY
jgi:hypothetical protein